jgi:hypothetical protein
MIRAFATVVLRIVPGCLAACAGSDRKGSGVEYLGRFDSDENRRPIHVDNIGPNPSPQVLVYGDGEH